MKALNEWCQKNGRPNFLFDENSQGPLHQLSWTVKFPLDQLSMVEFKDWPSEIISASSATKKEARNQCAAQVMEKLLFQKQAQPPRIAGLQVFAVAIENITINIIPPHIGRVKIAALDAEWDPATMQLVSIQVAETCQKVFVFTDQKLFEEYMPRVDQFVLFSGANDKKVLGLTNTIDILDLVPLRQHSATPSLQRLVQHYLHLHIVKSKKIQTSFTVAILTPEQLVYAATDAAATFALYQRLT